MKLKNSKYADASHAIRLLKRIEARQCTVGIMGLGYVGLPLALASIEAGFKVLGFDTNQARVDQLNGGDSGMKHISSPTARSRRYVHGDREARPRPPLS
jgi:UDP-N-acetyl-D-glucosamine dehydrogenase